MSASILPGTSWMVPSCALPVPGSAEALFTLPLVEPPRLQKFDEMYCDNTIKSR